MWLVERPPVKADVSFFILPSPNPQYTPPHTVIPMRWKLNHCHTVSYTSVWDYR